MDVSSELPQTLVMRLLLSILILLIVVNTATAQSGVNSFSVKMYVSPMVRLSGGDLECSVEKHGDNLKLQYKYRDSVGRGYYLDRRTRPLLESFLSSRRQVTMDSIRSLEKEYSFYRQDSLTVPTTEYRSFVELLEQILAKPKEALEDLEADKKLNVLDGATYSFHIQMPQTKKVINSINLDSALHPLLYRLSTQFMDIYKKEKHRDFLGTPLTSALCNSGLIANVQPSNFTHLLCKSETSDR